MASPNEGWTTLPRRLFASSAWRGSTPTTKAVAVWVLGRIRHFKLERRPHTPEGHVDATIGDIADECEVSRSSVRAALAQLEGVSFIRVHRRADGIRIELVNWQDWVIRVDTPPVFGRPTVGGVQRLAPDVQPLDVWGPTVGPLSTKQDQQGNEEMPLRGSTRNQTGDLFGEEIPAEVTRPAGHREVTAAFDRLYREANRGASPTWGAKQGKQIRQLIAAHDGDEIIRRMEIMFSGSVSWPPAPYTLDLFVRHLDAFAAAGAPQLARTSPHGRTADGRDPVLVAQLARIAAMEAAEAKRS